MIRILSELPESDKRVGFSYTRRLFKSIRNCRYINAVYLYFVINRLTLPRKLIEKFNIGAVFTNHDYEPYARTRDSEIGKLLKTHNIPFKLFKDQVIFEKNEITKEDNTPYTVFTPYSRKWKSVLNEFYLKPYPVVKYADNLLSSDNTYSFPKLQEMGFKETDINFVKPHVNESIISNYHLTRDIPAL